MSALPSTRRGGRVAKCGETCSGAVGHQKGKSMNAYCDSCQYTPEHVRASLRRTLAECEDCGNTYCDECLKEMAVEKGLVSETDAEAILEQEGADGFLTKCEESGLQLCPECFEDCGGDA